MSADIILPVKFFDASKLTNSAIREGAANFEGCERVFVRRRPIVNPKYVVLHPIPAWMPA